MADASSEYGALVRSRLAQHRLLIDAEIDCFDPAAAGQLPPAEERQQAPGGQQQKRQQQPPPLSSYIELKTYKLPQHPGQQRTLHRHKHPKWWLQSFLAGVPRLALGGRDDQARACVWRGVLCHGCWRPHASKLLQWCAAGPPPAPLAGAAAPACQPVLLTVRSDVPDLPVFPANQPT